MIPSKSAWIQVGALLDGVSASPLRDAHIVFDADQILYVGAERPDARYVGDRDAPDATYPNYTLLPGLIEAHAHLFLEGAELDLEKRKAYLELPPETMLSKAKDRLEKLVRLGVTGYRDAGDRHGVGLALSALYKTAGHPIMPYVDSPGAAIHHQGRYGAFMADPIENHATLEDVVKARADAGADRIKLIPTGIINFNKGAVTAAPQMSIDEVRALVDAARALGKQTFAHASGDIGIEHAIEGGVDSIEHGFFIRDDQLSRMRDREIAWVPTFAPVQMQVDHADRMGWSAEIVGNLKKILDQHARSLAKAREMGVIIIAGSDAGSCGVGHGLGFLYELELMERAGLPPIDILNSATGASARRLGYCEPIGRIEPGCRSRFILTEHSPLVSVSNLRKDRIVFYDGETLAGKESDDPSGL